jgi:hypothetical protein
MGQNVTRAVPLDTPYIDAFVTPSTATTTQIAPAVAGQRYRVLQYFVSATAAQVFQFLSNATPISATMHIGAAPTHVAPFSEHGWFQTAIGEALQISTTAATPSGVQVQYTTLWS